jgi:DNA (cytosine-5)-methyltransferase 1
MKAHAHRNADAPEQPTSIRRSLDPHPHLYNSGDEHGPNSADYTPTMLDVFSGIGGFSLAGEHAGFRTCAFAEIDPYACYVLRRHWPDIPNLGDVRSVTRESLGGRVDLIAGGFPCQPSSIGGAMRGTSDPRWLWPECARLLAEFKPSFGLFENVPGLLGVNDGQAFDGVLRDLAALRYDALWNCITASAVGAPHHRDRLWILAYANDGAGAPKRGQHAFAPQARAFGETYGAGSDVHAEREEPVRGPREVAGLDASSIAAADAQEYDVDTFTENWWAEPGVRRVVDGLPHRLDRLKCLGNSIVPQVAEVVLREIRRLIA